MLLTILYLIKDSSNKSVHPIIGPDSVLYFVDFLQPEGVPLGSVG